MAKAITTDAGCSSNARSKMCSRAYNEVKIERFADESAASRAVGQKFPVSSLSEENSMRLHMYAHSCIPW